MQKVAANKPTHQSAVAMCQLIGEKPKKKEQLGLNVWNRLINGVGIWQNIALNLIAFVNFAFQEMLIYTIMKYVVYTGCVIVPAKEYIFKSRLAIPGS